MKISAIQQIRKKHILSFRLCVHMSECVSVYIYRCICVDLRFLSCLSKHATFCKC